MNVEHMLECQQKITLPKTSIWGQLSLYLVKCTGPDSLMSLGLV